ncbi:hypothetical protein ABZ454_32855 [Streptomyces sp. NPDC005803]|uniref:hypothetical protein n=1 Tax=Streptomyces sp. NPDC005803 TaxID=3154297 RepID=UPI0034100CF3
MARADTLARARKLDRPDLAYIVRFASADGVKDMELTRTELAEAASWVSARLSEHGLSAGKRALITASGYEGFWVHPMIKGLGALRVPYGIAEGMGWDHRRAGVFQRELRPDAVIGLTAETLEGLAGAADLAETFRATSLILARPDALPVLRGAGVPAFAMTTVGPALALECPARAGAHVDSGAWRLSEEDGQLSIAAGEHRRSALAPTPLGIAGRVVTDRCACGNEDPRVLLAQADQR